MWLKSEQYFLLLKTVLLRGVVLTGEVKPTAMSLTVPAQMIHEHLILASSGNFRTTFFQLNHCR
jgi:hypothetical protein